MNGKLTLAYKKKKICEYILKAADKKTVDVYFESIDIKDHKEVKWWQDKDLVKMFEQELSGVKSGKISTISWTQAKKQLLSSKV